MFNVTCGVDNNAVIQVKELEDLCIYVLNSPGSVFLHIIFNCATKRMLAIFELMLHERYLKLKSDL
jgi:hypothetical protein